MALGKTPIIKDQKLLIEPNEWLAEIGSDYPALEKEYIGLELSKIPDNKAKTEALSFVRARWLGVGDAFRTSIGHLNVENFAEMEILLKV